MEKYLTKWIVLPLLVLIGVPAYSAEDRFHIVGQVLEKGTRRPLPAANVFVVGRDEIYTETDANGRFQLTVPEPGAYAVSAAALEFEKSFPTTVIVKELEAEAQLTIYLLPVVTMDTVVIVGERNADRVGKTVISGQELEQIAGTGGDPLKAIQSLPGITVANDASSEPAIRGARPGDNAYYIDDMEVSYLYHVGGLVSVLPADLVQDFNLFASAFSPQYDDVVGAVIDVALRDPRDDRLGGKVNVSLLASELLAEGPVTENQSFLFSARRSYFDLLVGEIEDEEEGVSFVVPNYWDYLGKYIWEINDNHRLKLYLNGAGDEVEFTISENAEVAEKEPILVGQSFSDQNYHNQTAAWESRLSNNSNNQLMLGHRRTSANSRLGEAFDADTYWDHSYVKDAFRYRGINKHDITTGAAYNKYEVKIFADGVNPRCVPGMNNPENCSDLTNAPPAFIDDTLYVDAWNAFVKDRWQLGKDVTWITGIRYSAENYLDESFVEPRFGVEWDFNKKTLFTAGWGLHHQFPEGRFVIEEFGNPDLGHIKSEHSVVGMEYHLNKDWFFKTDLYYKSFSDLITADNDNETFINGGSGESYGIELLIKKNPTDALSGWLALTLSEAERQIDASGERFPFAYDQPVIVSFVSNYKLSRRWNFGAKWHYHSGSPYTPIIGGEPDPNDANRTLPVYGSTNSERLPAYHRLDLRVDFDWIYNTWKLQTYFEIINVYNNCNVAGYDYDTNYDPNTKEEFCQLPFLPSFGVQAAF